jgi:hypothetical protein
MAVAMGSVLSPDLDYSIQSALLQRTNSGVLITFPTRGSDPHDRSEWQTVVITWAEIEPLVNRSRAAGKAHHFKNVKYYADE